MFVTGSAGAVSSANAAPLVELVGDPVIEEVMDDAPVFCSSSSSSYVDNWKTIESQVREVNNAIQTRPVAVCYHCFSPIVDNVSTFASCNILVSFTLPLRPNLTLACFPLATLRGEQQ